MILILSQRENELTTDEIIQWIDFYKEKVIRVNGADLMSFEYEEFNIYNDEISLNINDISIVFFRRLISFNGIINFNNLNVDRYSKRKFLNHIQEEFKSLYNFFINKFKDIEQVSSYKDEKRISKLVVLNLAKEIGLNTPTTFVSSNRENVVNFIKKNKKVIVKPMSECQYYTVESTHYKMLTELITQENINLIPNFFFPSLFQKYIEKKYEIRVFFIDNTCYSMAIFSQGNKKTKIDFRNYDNVKPNRTVSYKLPNKIEDKIIKLMNILNLKTGSIDLIRSNDGNYIFLEINPNGQFGMVSYPCNYFLEETVAKYLIKKKDANKKIYHSL